MNDSNAGADGSQAVNRDTRLIVRYALRVLWMAIQIILVLWIGQKGAQFFYQRF